MTLPSPEVSREALETLLTAAAQLGWLTEPHSVRQIRVGQSGLLPWRIETPLLLIGATVRDGTPQMACVPLQAPLGGSGLRQGAPAVQRKLALAKPLGEALDPVRLEQELGLVGPPSSIVAPEPEAPVPTAPRSWRERWQGLLRQEEVPPVAGPPTPSVWPLPLALGGAELGAYLQTQRRLEQMLGWPEVVADPSSAYRVRAALTELLPETRALYLNLPPSLRRPSDFAATLNQLVPSVARDEAQRRWEAHQRFLRER